ncbi:MAG: hypothetical protein WDO15_11780 [Bacteroidota bacterium]
MAPIWPASGSFTITDQHDIKRNDGMTINVTSLTDSQVIFELFYTSPGGRVTGVSGHYKFEMAH